MIFGWIAPGDIQEEFRDIVNTICRMATAYYYFGKLNNAIKLLTATQVFIEQSGAKIPLDIQFHLTDTLSEILCASIFYQHTHLDQALPTLLLNKQVAESDLDGTIDAQAVSNALEDLGLAYYNHKLNTGEGDSSTSLAYFQQALALRQNTPGLLGKSETLFHIGLVYENGDQHDSEKALFYYNQAYQPPDSDDFDELEQSYVARHLGGIAEAQGDFEQAKYYYEESLALREKIGFEISFPFSYHALGNLYFIQKDWDSASRHYWQAISFAREMDTPIPLIASLLGLGELHQAQNERAEALTYFEEALELARKLDATDWIAEAASRVEGLTS